MGIYDRGYYRNEPSFGFSAGAAGSVVKTLIMINVAIFVADMFSPTDDGGQSRWLSDFLALKPNLMQKPWNAWQLLTAGFAHAPMSSARFVWHIFGNMLGLFFFGPPLESRYGSKEFLRMYLSCIVLANLVWAIAKELSGGFIPLYGASGGVTGVVMLFVLLYPTQKVLLNFFIPVPAWVLGVFLIGSDLRGALNNPEAGIAFTVHLTGAGLAFLYWWSGIRLTNFFPDGFSLPTFNFNKPKLRVHRPRDNDLDRRADEILDKVHREGADSISAEERKILDDYSRKMRQKLR